MIRFIDKNTGNVYDGSKPYTHWFDGKQSLGLNYDKVFIIITESPNVTIKTNSNIFYIVDNHKIEYPVNESSIERTFYDKKYLDLSALKTNEIHYTGNDELKIQDYYLYTFNIVAQGKTVGEITDSFFINDEEFTIGADFVEDNEILSINLANFGVELSNEVQRAIYEKDINEQKTDFVLLNRKYKELLNEYINIIGNKGSYKSLINSLKWFEYGELAKIYEYWKHAEPNKSYLSKRDITQFVNEQTESLLYSNTKTTYIGISIALEQLKKSNGFIEYENSIIVNPNKYPQLLDEPNPVLEKISMLWSKNEMMLKSVLLGNFFATYFLPIHLDLIHSTVEDIIYSDTIKITSFPKIERFDNLDEIYPIKCKLEKTYHLTNVETYTNLDTLFGFSDKGRLISEDENIKILGVDTKFTVNDDIKASNMAYNTQHFKGIGVIIPFTCEMLSNSESSIITNGTIKLYKKSDENQYELFDERNDYSVNYEPVNGKFFINFNILIQDIGDYKVQLSFRRSDGCQYFKVLDFSVDGENHIDLRMFKLIPKYDNVSLIPSFSTWMDDNINSTIELGNIADYVLNPVQYNLNGKNDASNTIYTQFIAISKSITDKTVHTNQVIIIKNNIKDSNNNIDNAAFETFVNKHIKIKIGDGNEEYAILNNYNENFTNNFEVIKMNRFGGEIKNESSDEVLITLGGEEIAYIMLINKNFTNDNVNIHGEIVFSNNADKSNVTIWNREMFIPYFYKLEEIGSVSEIQKIVEKLSDEEIYKKRNGEKSYTISHNDVVCFLPDLRCLRRPKDFMWKFKCMTDNSEITPITYRTSNTALKNENHVDKSEYDFPTILQPLFGRYDFRILPQKGFYDITFMYRLSDEEKNQTKSISSMFLYKKQEKEKIIIPKRVKQLTEQEQKEKELNELLTEILEKVNVNGFEENFIEN